MDKSNEIERTNSSEIDVVPAEMTTAEVLAEVERRQAERRATNRPGGRAIVVVDRLAFWFSKHWLAVFNAFAFFYVGLPTFAPMLMHLNAQWLAKIIYTIYRPLCHQLPQRSFFLFGPQWTYAAKELMERLETSIGLGTATRAFVGNDAIGYKVGLCQRDVAIYGVILLAGLAFGFLRRFWKISSLPWWAYIGLGILPMLLDGGYQFVSYIVPLFWSSAPITPHETTPTMRVVTGALFGLATVWLAYPIVQESMEEMRESFHKRFGWS
ncbi:MAG: DUF2085 domain-containing protein [Chloroflexi bacterium]|nr:DUF2085 domain-containing protein [Chloroflexota bacterium]